MLSELRIENFAIISQLELSFNRGLNIFTGETGAGKSIIIDAVETILGSRADAIMIRVGAERAMIEASFEISDETERSVRLILEREALLDESKTLTLGREIRTNGRSFARVNGRNVNNHVLTELSEFLVDVHGQSEHLSLLHVKQHLGLLDSYAHVEPELVKYQEAYHQLTHVRNQLNELQAAEKNASRQIDVLQYQINEIESAHLREGEEEELRIERTRLANAEGIASLVQEAIQLLDEGTPESPSVTDQVGQVTSILNNLSRLDSLQEKLSERSQNALEELSDLTTSLREYIDTIEFNPKRLDQVEERLNLIQNLKRKYGENIPTVLQFVEMARTQLDSITHVSERIVELEGEENQLLVRLGELGETLSVHRHSAAEKLEKTLESELGHLSMAEARFKVDFTQRLSEEGVFLTDGRRVTFDSTGLEHVEFQVAPNPGEGLKPLVKIASGGETSRLMLAIKNVLAQADRIPTLIFDEIDQGIGGRVGMVVGRKLWELARQHQVLCVTHLPQLAAFGEQHWKVLKQVREGRTETVVESLEGDERLIELAQMMGEISDGTRQSAKELLQSVDQTVKK
ncbi:MAG: DNA repair protein RecN [Chloroflexi bacterium RBG_16_47_49]|nr:MAG: DNA repair protein RecN [Chloroflexi bacterium RBG_16_47_49]